MPVPADDAAAADVPVDEIRHEVAHEIAEEIAEEVSPRVGTGRRLWGYAKLLLGFGAYLFVALRVASEWDRVRDQLDGASVPWLAVGVAAGAAGMVVIAVAWGHLLTVMGHHRPPVRVASWYFVGEIWKYLPGGVWPILGRGEIARQHRVPRATAYTSVILSLALLYMAGMVVAAVLLPAELLWGEVPAVTVVILAALPAALVTLHPRLVHWGARHARRVKPDLEVPVLSYRQMVVAMGQYAPSWLLNGGVTVIVAHAVAAGEGSWHRLLFAAVISWVAGFLVFFLPAGAGVREAVFIASAGLADDTAITIAVVARLVFIAVDVVGALVGRALEHRAERIRPRAAPAPE